jgi:DnaJ-domain-containing protein 1
MKTIREEKESRIARFPEFEKAASEDHFDAAVGTLAQLKFLRKWEQQCQERLLTLLEY